MKNWSFKTQMRLAFGVFLACMVLAHLTKQGWISNVGWIVYGLLFLIHPVWPQSWDWRNHDDLRRGCRIAGGIAIVIGLITRFGV